MDEISVGEEEEEEEEGFSAAVMEAVLLPRELIVEEVLSRLPVKSLLRLRCVCKAWRDLVCDPFFINLHMIVTNLICLSWRDWKIYSLDPENPDHQLVEIGCPYKGWCYGGSCDGLLCLISGTVSLLNPSTRKHMTNTESHYFSIDTTAGFFHDSISNDYKLLQILYDYCIKSSEVEVYSFAGDSVSKFGLIPYYLDSISKVGALVNGVLHWQGTSTVHESSTSKPVILAFKIVDKEFIDFPLPGMDGSDPEHTPGSRLVELGGCLASVQCGRREYDTRPV